MSEWTWRLNTLTPSPLEQNSSEMCLYHFPEFLFRISPSYSLWSKVLYWLPAFLEFLPSPTSTLCSPQITSLTSDSMKPKPRQYELLRVLAHCSQSFHKDSRTPLSEYGDAIEWGGLVKRAWVKARRSRFGLAFHLTSCVTFVLWTMSSQNHMLTP